LAILSPEHLIDQAERLIAPTPPGRPRQVDLRRAISTAYYAVFHAILAAAADLFVGTSKRSSSQYNLVYRSVDHVTIRELCAQVQKQIVPRRLVHHTPSSGFGPNMQAFAAAVVDVQKMRHEADYDPSINVARSDALLAISTARLALARFKSATSAQRDAFLSLLVFKPR
jgi:uncharacterized protein (UPF0332 family)